MSCCFFCVFWLVFCSVLLFIVQAGMAMAVVILFYSRVFIAGLELFRVIPLVVLVEKSFVRSGLSSFFIGFLAMIATRTNVWLNNEGKN